MLAAALIAGAILIALPLASIDDPDQERVMPNLPRQEWCLSNRIVGLMAFAALAAVCVDAVRRWWPLAIVLLVTLIVSCQMALAHSWYPFECCSDQDCAPVENSAIEETSAGFLIKATGEVVAFDKAKVSPDGRYHICRFPSGGLICFFRPLRGV